MPPKVVYSRETIIQTAFDLVKEFGFHMLSTRKVAEKLNASPSPIYNQFRNIEELKFEVLQKTKALLVAYTKKKYTNGIFLNIGVGFVVFSREHFHLFNMLLDERESFYEMFDIFIDLMSEDDRFASFSSEEKRELLRKMYIISYGLAIMIANGHVEDSSDEYIIRTLDEFGQAIIQNEINNKKMRLLNSEGHQ